MTSRATKTLSDTHARAAHVQLELLRQASPEKRLQLMESFSREVRTLSLRSLERKCGDSLLAKLEWVRLNYGDDLANRVDAELRRLGRLP